MEADQEPIDYRFTLANERTYLAWVRTALAMIAGGIAIRIFMKDARDALPLGIAAVGLTLLGGLVTALAYRHWVATQAAMERGDPLPNQRGPLILTVGVLILALIIVVSVVL